MARSLAYDHPMYITAEQIMFTAGTNPSGNVAQRQTVMVNMIARSAQLTVGITGTNTSTVALIRVSGSSTSTTTIASYIIGTGVVTGTSIGTGVGQTVNVLCTSTLLAGDQIAFLNGVDISVGVCVAVEAYIVPGASLQGVNS